MYVNWLLFKTWETYLEKGVHMANKEIDSCLVPIYYTWVEIADPYTVEVLITLSRRDIIRKTFMCGLDTTNPLNETSQWYSWQRYTTTHTVTWWLINLTL